MSIPIILIDSMEEDYVQDKFREEFEDCITAYLGIWDCENEWIRLLKDLNPVGTCDSGEIAEILIADGFIKSECPQNCPKRKYVQVADFSNNVGSFWAERKRVDDAYSSLVSGRLYEQLDKLDGFFEDNKFFILEGDVKYKFFEDSYNKKSPFKPYANTKSDRFRKLSPIEQLVEISGGKTEWVWSIIKECVSRNINFIQTKNINETVQFIKLINMGAGQEPKYRIIPKRYPKVPIEQNILILLKGIGEVKSKQILNKYKTLPNLIKSLSKLKESPKNKLLFELWEIFIKGRTKFPIGKKK